MKHTVEVTNLDLKRGKPGTSNACPIARAVSRSLNKSIVSVGYQLEGQAGEGSSAIAYVEIGPTKKSVRYDAHLKGEGTAELAHWLSNYDRYRGAFPITIELIERGQPDG